MLVLADMQVRRIRRSKIAFHLRILGAGALLLSIFAGRPLQKEARTGCSTRKARKWEPSRCKFPFLEVFLDFQKSTFLLVMLVPNLVPSLRKRARAPEGFVLQSPEALDVVRHNLLPLLSARSVARLEQVSQTCRALVAESDIWQRCADRHLAACTYVPAAVLAIREADPKGALQTLARDLSRTSLNLDEMCSFEWCCFFSGSGDNVPIRFVFRHDGSIVRAVNPTEARPHHSDSHAHPCVPPVT